MTEYTRLRPHWRPSHNADPVGFDRWIAPDGANGWVKILNPDGHLCRRVWSVAPDARLCLRLHPMSEQKAEMMTAPVDLGRSHATYWHNWLTQHGLLDAAKAGRVALEGINEAAIWQQGVSEALVAYEISRMEHTARLGMPGICCVMQVNTGWPGNHGITDAPPDWSPFEPLREALLRLGGYLGIHEYWDRRGPDSSDWTWNPGRIVQQPASWDAIPVLITECGYDQAVNAPDGTPHHGWLGHMSVDEAMEQSTEYDRRLRTIPRLRKRVKAAFIFTHDFDPPWGTFDTIPLTDRLAGHAEWTRQQPAPIGVSGDPHTIHIPTVIAPSPVPPTATPPTPQPQDNWTRSRAFIARWEGGYQNVHNDRGNWTGGEVGVGENKGTKYGISAASYPHLDIKNLTMQQADAIYFTDYWQASGADTMAWPACLLVLDTAVLHGVGTAKAYLQEAGPNPYVFAARRLRIYTRMSNWDFWGKAWCLRVADLLEEMAK